MTEAINKAPAPELRDCKGSLPEIAMLLKRKEKTGNKWKSVSTRLNQDFR